MPKLGEAIYYLQMMQGIKDARERKALEADRYIINKLTENWHNAESTTQRKHIQESMRSAMRGMTSRQKEALAPYLKMTPLGPMAIKQQMFEEHFGKNRPKITADPDLDPHLYGQQLIASKRFEAFKQRSLTGASVPELKVALFSSDKKDYIAVRGNDGVVRSFSYDEAYKRQMADQFGVSFEELVANGGDIYPNTSFLYGMDGVYKVDSGKNVWTGDPLVRSKKVQDVPYERRSGDSSRKPQFPRQQYSDLKMVRHAFKTGDMDASPIMKTIWEQANDLAEKTQGWGDFWNEGDPKDVDLVSSFITGELQKQFPGWSFRIAHSDKARKEAALMIKNRLWETHITVGDGADLVAIPGEPAKIKGPDGKDRVFYYDKNKDIVYDPWGVPAGTYEEFVWRLYR